MNDDPARAPPAVQLDAGTSLAFERTFLAHEKDRAGESERQPKTKAAKRATKEAGTSGSKRSRSSRAATLAPPNPYSGGPNTGITLPPYYRPTPSMKNANTFFPGAEQLGHDEMRISFIGSSPVPPTRAQAGTAIMVELGNGKRFFCCRACSVASSSKGSQRCTRPAVARIRFFTGEFRSRWRRGRHP